MSVIIHGRQFHFGTGLSPEILPPGWTLRESPTEFARGVDPDGRGHILDPSNAAAYPPAEDEDGAFDFSAPVPLRRCRVTRRRTKGWRMPADTVCVGRPGPWGNPFVIREGPGGGFELHDTTNRYGFRGHLIRSYRSKREAALAAKLCFEFHVMVPKCYDHEISPRLIREHLKDKNLACWCAAGDPCHADVLLKFANEPER